MFTFSSGHSPTRDCLHAYTEGINGRGVLLPVKGSFGPLNPAAIGCQLTFAAGVAESDSIGFDNILPT